MSEKHPRIFWCAEVKAVVCGELYTKKVSDIYMGEHPTMDEIKEKAALYSQLDDIIDITITALNETIVRR